MAFTSVDMIIIAIVLASALMALLRGFNREVLTIFAWAIAAAGAIYAFPFSREFFRQQLTTPALADGVAFVLIFLLILIPSLMLAGHIMRRFGASEPGVLDRTGGFLFGVARGLFVVGLGYWAHAQILEPGTEPYWIEDARLRPIVISVAGIFPSDVEALSNSSGGSGSQNSSRQSADDADTGYDQKDRRGLDQLITTTSED